MALPSMLRTSGFTVAVDHLVLGRNNVVPADKTTLSPPKLKRNWDVRKGFGIQGAFCVYTGEGLATFDVTFEFWNEEKEALWDRFASTHLSAPKGVKPAAIGIYHPILMKPPFAIQFVVVTDIEGWGPVTPGRWQTRLSLLEFRPEPKMFSPAKTEPDVPPTDPAAPPKPRTAIELEIEEKTDRLRKLMNLDARNRIQLEEFRR